jgi:cellulose synthase/poly-beta-1,6-N-acetylglucosamine synthase-like glycosyltransferase
MACPPLASPRDIISRFAVVVKNLVRPVGLVRLGGPALLTGSGMAFRWELLADRPLATGHIVEDMQLGFDLLLEGKPPQLLPEAGIQGSLAESGGAALTQRTRWEHGHMHVMSTQLPRLLLAAIRRPRWVICMAALDLCVPPLSFLVTLWGLLLLVSATWYGALNGSPVPLQIALSAGAALGLGIASGWWRFARHETSFWSLALVPFYIIAKLPIYLRFLLLRRERKWVRTTRGENRCVES